MNVIKTTRAAVVLAIALTLPLAACSSGKNAKTATGGIDGAKVAFLMPDQASTRYEQHDAPGFKAALSKLCASCTALYNNANADAAKQQQQFDAAISQGVKAIVIDPVDSTAAASMVSRAQARGIKVVAYDRPIPDAKVDYYVSFDNEAIGKAIAESLVKHMKDTGVPTDKGILEVNGSPTDAAAGLIKKGIHEGLASGGYATLAEYDTPDWEPTAAQQWVAGQVSRFGGQIGGIVAANDGTAGGAIAALKAANVKPIPPVTGNDATNAGLQLVISGDQYNTISKPSEIVAAAAAEVVVDLVEGKQVEAVGGGNLTTVFKAPTMLFVPKVVTRDNLKADIVDAKINTAAELCTGAYATGCTALGIS
ncbi:substrate-binding domain-containing protein [Nocardia vinacea]|uniref:Substrate-binding domain-containing protein n=1 Tax=Nocardia vinacea TaxID=96468 RepID=A0ABZ1YUA4_9NOCA|nr:substrate-binding domain-containing protein [Nocardia vinacea]